MAVQVTRELGPAVTGLRRPEILIPEWLYGLPVPQRSLVVRHESEHVRARDTVLLASDGLFDNLHTHEIVGVIRKGKLTRAAETLRSRTESRMAGEQPPHRPSKPDDLTFLLYRPTGAG